MAYQTETEQYWWVYAVAGVLSILFGVVAIIWPYITLAVLVILFGVYVLIAGVLALIAMIRQIQAHRTWWPQLLLGLIGIVAGLFVLFYPGMSTYALALVIAFWAILIGLFEIVAGLTLPRFLFVIVGILTTLFGFILLANPEIGIVALVIVVGVFAIVRGIILLFDAIRAPGASPTLQ